MLFMNYDNTYQEQQIQCNNDSDISEDSNCEGFDLELKPLKPIIEKLLKIVALFSMFCLPQKMTSYET